MERRRDRPADFEPKRSYLDRINYQGMCFRIIRSLVSTRDKNDHENEHNFKPRFVSDTVLDKKNFILAIHNTFFLIPFIIVLFGSTK
jgi:hypothetical protein